jgi:hypothetical protein
MNYKNEKEKIEKTNIKKYCVEGDTFKKGWFSNIQWCNTTF